MKLNLGSSDRHFPGYVNVDVAPPADQLADLAGPWPWEDSSIDEIRAWDIIEHIGDCDHFSADYNCDRCTLERHFTVGPPEPGEKVVPKRHWRGQIHVMNEAWRVLRKGGTFDIEVPSTRGAGAFCDPQHVSFWNASSFEYFQVGNAAHTRFRKAYGVEAAFNLVSIAQTSYRTPYDEVWKVKVLLQAVK